jgi:hypothetical protein
MWPEKPPCSHSRYPKLLHRCWGGGGDKHETPRVIYLCQKSKKEVENLGLPLSWTSVFLIPGYKQTIHTCLSIKSRVQFFFKWTVPEKTCISAPTYHEFFRESQMDVRHNILYFSPVMRIFYICSPYFLIYLFWKKRSFGSGH